MHNFLYIDVTIALNIFKFWVFSSQLALHIQRILVLTQIAIMMLYRPSGLFPRETFKISAMSLVFEPFYYIFYPLLPFRIFSLLCPQWINNCILYFPKKMYSRKYNNNNGLLHAQTRGRMLKSWSSLFSRYYIYYITELKIYLSLV